MEIAIRVSNLLLWMIGICAVFGIGCIAVNAMLWWRNHVKRSPGAAWWTRM